MPTHPHSRALYTTEQLRELEGAALTTMGITGYDLMHRAATAALHSLRRHWPQLRQLGICCGPGNNGGDGFLLGVLARAAGLQVEIVALSTTSHGDAAVARREWEAAGGRVQLWDAQSKLPVVDVLVDALYGIGFNRALEPSAARLIDSMHASGKPVLALDVPTGLNADTGHCLGVAVRADLTLTFIADKRGLHSGRAADHVGVLELASLGAPDSVYAGIQPDARLLAAEAMPSRERYANKGYNGHVLVIGGDHGMAGAVRLAGESALRAGAGLVSVATRADHLLALNATRPELMVHAVDDLQALVPLLEHASVLALGPGLGQGAWAHALWQATLGVNKPLVLDADGLNLLAQRPCTFNVPTVLTPHPGEAGRLLGVSTADVERDRFSAVRELARCYSATVVLKGSGSLVADPDGRLDVCPWGNPGMASGGMGDLLTGVIAALLAQGCTASRAARLGVGLHARAGDLAAQHGERGLLASDLLAPLRLLGNGLSGQAHD
ncbi:bifunctional ADP-dependent (S)-NAD(P)H-hydrate dehydratase/NAD(P)H-hydrate epimerase [Rhodanobacter sp. B04]|uniref:NAD(P)H-hydrate dehydratase n=1 Tax=Rhodanobacter sp. B04 TaxID=1945860 RepID=UPI00098766F2|nr:NAD(P)H-hydrate dehydratase [Rhodanobacter sp. B04]OOG61509.1 bifunctional ADP-dependent (S)-NAD(P)H-hydrate dehydratase/NAD(P)H-hydrate epimerase [Rhodanobacter sp. B04]